MKWFLKTRFRLLVDFNFEKWAHVPVFVTLHTQQCCCVCCILFVIIYGYIPFLFLKYYSQTIVINQRWKIQLNGCFVYLVIKKSMDIFMYTDIYMRVVCIYILAFFVLFSYVFVGSWVLVCFVFIHNHSWFMVCIFSIVLEPVREFKYLNNDQQVILQQLMTMKTRTEVRVK